MSFLRFKYPVYNPNVNTIDVARDWLVFPNTTTDPDLALSQPFKVATVRACYTDPSVFSYDPTLPKVDLSKFDLVLISDAEYYRQRDIVKWAKQQGITNYLIAVGGLSPDEVLEPSTVYRPYWLTHFLNNNTEPVDTYADTKQYLYEALLGSQRPHRDYVMLALTNSGLIDKSIVTYRDCFPGGIVDTNTENVHREFPNTTFNRPYVSPNLNPKWEVRKQISNTVSFITPYDIYRNTHYSIVCETLSTGKDFFFSEKIMKPMFAKRVFVLFGPQGYLQKLRNFGFQTFEELIDESYDDEPVDIERYKKAMMQVMRLGWLEQPARVYKQINYVLECNFNRLYSWQTECQCVMSDMVKEKIPARHFIWD